MTYTETTVCETCGHHFRSDASLPQPSFNPERTQMLTLPPSVTQSAPPQTMPHEPITYIEPVARSRRARVPLVGIIVVIALVLGTGLYMLLH